MENILVKGKRNVSKIFILALIFIGIIGALSVVNAAEETINLIVGQSTQKNPGIETTWGGYKEIICTSGDKSIVETAFAGTELKGGSMKARTNLKFIAKKPGKCTISVTYYASFWATKETKIYNINVEEVKPKEITVTRKPLKDVYNVGEKIDLKGLILNVKNNDGKDGDSPSIDQLTFSPTVAPNQGGKNITITVEYKGVKTNFEVYVNPIKTNDSSSTNTNTNTNANTKPNTNTNTNTKPNTSTNTTTTAPQYSNGTAVKVSDSVKMSKGNSWKVYSDSSCKNVKSYIKVSEGLTYKVESISGNIVKLSQGGKKVGYIKWYNSSTGAMSYFSKVDSSNQNSSVAGNNSATGNNSNTGKQEVTTEAVSEVLNLMTKLISTILKSILQCISTVK